MGMAELGGHITVSLLPLCLRGIMTGLATGDDECFDREYLLNAYRGISTLFGKMFRNFPNRQTMGPVGHYLHGATAPVHFRSQGMDQKQKSLKGEEWMLTSGRPVHHPLAPFSDFNPLHPQSFLPQKMASPLSRFQMGVLPSYTKALAILLRY